MAFVRQTNKKYGSVCWGHVRLDRETKCNMIDVIARAVDYSV